MKVKMTVRAGGSTAASDPNQLQITGHYCHNVEFLQNAEIKQSVIRSFPVATVPVTSGIQHTRCLADSPDVSPNDFMSIQKYILISITAHHKGINYSRTEISLLTVFSALYRVILSKIVRLLLLVQHLYSSNI